MQIYTLCVGLSPGFAANDLTSTLKAWADTTVDPDSQVVDFTFYIAETTGVWGGRAAGQQTVALVTVTYNASRYTDAETEAAIVQVQYSLKALSGNQAVPLYSQMCDFVGW